MKVCSKDSDGLDTGNYSCDKCGRLFPFNSNGFSIGKIVVDLETLHVNHFCSTCIKVMYEVY